MAEFVRMPQLGSTMEEGTVLRWHKAEGETVARGETLLEIETDKSVMEVESPAAGVLLKILVSSNEVAPVQQPIAVVGAPAEEISSLLALSGNGRAAREVVSPAPPDPSAHSAQPENTQSAVAVSPRARRLADRKGVLLRELVGQGTGPQGRIIERDVEGYLLARSAAATPTLPAATEAESGSPRPGTRATPLAAKIADDLGIALEELATGLPGSRVRRDDVLRFAETARTQMPEHLASPGNAYATRPLAGMRRRIADNVARSAFSAPHVTLTLEVDMTEAASLRARLLPDIERVYGVRLSFNDLLVKAVARALNDFPEMNAALVGEEIRVYQSKNIGVAVALEEGLVAPVMREVERKTLGTVAVELKELIERARAGRFTPDDLAGGTFTLSNLGSFGIDVFNPIIVAPQAAILGVGRIADKPVVVEKQVVVRTMMNLCLSFDHRIVDGAPAARFLQRLKELLEAPMLILV